MTHDEQTPDPTTPLYVAVCPVESDPTDPAGWSPVPFRIDPYGCDHAFTMCPGCVHGGWSDDYNIGPLPMGVQPVPFPARAGTWFHTEHTAYGVVRVAHTYRRP